MNLKSFIKFVGPNLNPSWIDFQYVEYKRWSWENIVVLCSWMKVEPMTSLMLVVEKNIVDSSANFWGHVLIDGTKLTWPRIEMVNVILYFVHDRNGSKGLQ